MTSRSGRPHSTHSEVYTPELLDRSPQYANDSRADYDDYAEAPRSGRLPTAPASSYPPYSPGPAPNGRPSSGPGPGPGPGPVPLTPLQQRYHGGGGVPAGRSDDRMQMVAPVQPHPGGSGYQPSKRIVVCCDGTWLDSDSSLQNHTLQLPSNVTRISRAILAESPDGIPQVVYYQAGIGSQGGPVNRLVGGATAEGISANIREAYAFVANNYQPGDELFFLGFSRGAFTARSVAGLIDAVGLLTKAGIGSLGVIFKDWEHRLKDNYESEYPNVPFPNKPSAEDPRYARELERRKLTRLDIPIKAIGVWDTVGALGIPHVNWLERIGLQKRSVRDYAFYDTSLGNCVEHAFQALALDEHRAPFSPTVWEKRSGNTTKLYQVWFPGVHSNVGGGSYADIELANITLCWMVAQLEPFLAFDHSYVINEQHRLEVGYYTQSGQLPPREWSMGEIYNSMTGVYALAGRRTRTPGFYMRVDPRTGVDTDRPLKNTNEYIHPCVRARVMLDGPGVEDKGLYEPKALDGYRLRMTGQGPREGMPIAVWESRAMKKPKAGGEGKGGRVPRRVLPESPLFETERRLLAYSPRVAQYVLAEGRSSRPPRER